MTIKPDIVFCSLDDEDEPIDDFEEPLVITLDLSQPIESTQKTKPRKSLWKKVERSRDVLQEPDFVFDQNDSEIQEDDFLQTPIMYFRKFIDEQIISLLVEQSNIYSVQKDPERPLKLSKEELDVWLGLSLMFSLSKISNTRLHWSVDFSNDKYIHVMTRKRWEDIKSNLHLVDNTKLDINDKISKVRPLVEHLRNKFQDIPMTKELCIDESIVPFKGRSSIKVYVPKKPHKWGYRFYVLADKYGLVYDFFIGVGKMEPVGKEGVPDLGASANIVLNLAQIIPEDKNFRLYFDNYFNSVPLQTHLATKKIWCCGTVQANRVKNLKFIGDKELKVKGRGSFEEWESFENDQRVRCLKWFDNRPVHLLSTFIGAEPTVEKTRYDRKAKCNVIVTCPKMVDSYNKAMGGVDLHDQLIALYRFSFKSKKFYHRMLFHLIDMAIVNAWLLYRRDADRIKIPPRKQLSLSEFKIKIAKALIFANKPIKRTQRGRPSLEIEDESKRRKLNRGLPLPEKDLRYDHIDHLPNASQERHLCKMTGCKSKITTYCIKCKVYLCISNKNSCFLQFHTK